MVFVFMKELHSIKVEGYKSFNNETEILLSPFVTVFIGKNNCGKSSCIDMLESVLLPNHFNSVTSQFQKVSVSFNLKEENIERGFPKNTRGGLIGGNHFEYGIKFIGMPIYTDVTSRLGSGDKYIKLECSKNQSVIPDTDKIPSNWDNVVRSFNSFQNNYQFRRVNADRDIIPEIESADENVAFNGSGVTNLLRKFVNNSKYDEKLVEEILLAELNKIMYPDSKFNQIRLQEIEDSQGIKWEIFLEESNGKRFALSKSGSGLKTIILMLANLYIIPETKLYKGKKIYFAFEELENNLHPALQRKVFEYLYNYASENDTHIFITTHSHIAVNTFFNKRNVNIYHVEKSNGSSSASLVLKHSECMDVLADLDVKASDLFQSNGIIWVEGPSDRIYINRWLKEFCHSEFLEGSDYQFLYYGGRNLSHYSTDDSAVDLINILTTNKNAAIVIDSDKTTKNKPINGTKKRIKEEFEKIGAFCWITQGKEIENYISADSISNRYGKKTAQIGQYELFPDYISSFDKNFSSHKVKFARDISEHITFENSKSILDLEKKIESLYNAIKKWNMR